MIRGGGHGLFPCGTSLYDGHRLFQVKKGINDMENFRESMYAACRQMGMAIVPMDTGARVMAFVGLQGGDERTVMCRRLRCELHHMQEVYHILGGEVPDTDFVALIQKYTKELKDYTDAHDGEWPEWLNDLIQERYGFKPYKL